MLTLIYLYLFQTFKKEMKVWEGLEHNNILQLIGYILEGELKIPTIITPWYPMGTARQYVSRGITPDELLTMVCIGISLGANS